MEKIILNLTDKESNRINKLSDNQKEKLLNEYLYVSLNEILDSLKV